MKINFKEFKAFIDISHRQTTTLDVREILANFIYTTATGIQAHDLAFRIYRSEEAVELNPADVDLLLQLSNGMTPIFMDSLKDALNG